MKRLFAQTVIVVAAMLSAVDSRASSTLPMSTTDLVNASAAVFRGVAVGTDCYRDANDGQIYTRTSLRVIEPLKGTFPTIVAVVHRGGLVGDIDEFYGGSPTFNYAGEYVVHVMRRADGKLTCTQGSASAIKLARVNGQFIPEHQTLLEELRNVTNNGQIPGDNVTDQTGFATSQLAFGLINQANGLSARFIAPDRGEVIPYLIDPTSLPTGISFTQATNAVAQALSAWTAVTKIQFRLDGIGSFVTNADALAADDERLWIQLHDNFNAINNPSVLGIGGRSAITNTASAASGWGAGGRIGTNEFNKSIRGYVVLERTNAAMQNLSTFTEVLCHEIGHALSMAHSAETATNNSVVTNSIMFYLAHADGRGATLGAWDPPVIQQAHPTNNTPPYTYPRVMDITTTPGSPPNVPGINEIEMRGYDLQNDALTLFVTNATGGGGTFTKVGNMIKYAPSGFIGASRLDPGDPSSPAYHRIYARFTDGTNASPYVQIRTISYNPDTSPFPAPSDGIPDDWMTTYFGHVDPQSGDKSRAQDDKDNDRRHNLDEYRTGMNPNDATSAQWITSISPTNIQFQAMAYELYELHASTNLTNWVRAVNPVLPTTSTGSFTGFTNTAPAMFFRVQKVP